MTPHPLLARLLRRVGASLDTPPSAETWQQLLGLVSRTYHDADQDRYTLERSIDISSRELQGLYHDLKRKSERKLEESYATICATLEAANAGIVVVDRARRLIAMNRRFAEIFAVPADVLARADHDELVQYSTSRHVDGDALARVQAIHQTAEVASDELALVDGAVIERYSAPIRLPSGELVGRVTFFRDITAERTLNRQLEQAREAAEAASRAKSMFLASMSHELRTPLNAVIGLSDLMMIDGGETLDARQREYLDGILHSGRHLLALVNDVLDLSKVEAGKQDFFPVRIGACEAVEEAVSLLAPLADHRGVSLAADVPSEEAYLLADPLRLRQILYNLISNAVKFTARDRCVRVSAASEDGNVSIAVSDQGAGIAREDQPRLFRAFEQIDTPAGDRPPGTGLGLALTKRLVDMHGGTIDVISQLGVGTTFTVRIPAAREETL